MSNDLHTMSEPGLASLVSGIISDAQALLKQEVALARSEVTQEIRKTRDALISLGIGIAIATVGGLLLVLTLVHLLNWLTDGQLPLWACYGIIGALMVIIGGAVFFIGSHKASEINIVPRQTMETMKENVQWIKNQT